MNADAHGLLRRPALAAVIGACAATGALALCFVAPALALKAWLAAAFLWTGVPIGALGLVMMMRLIPGAWTAALEVPAEAAALLLPLAAASFVPVLLGIEHLYPWTEMKLDAAFRSAYLAGPSFVGRTILGFGLLSAIMFALRLLPSWSTPISSAGLIVYVLVTTTVAVDWLMSRDPHFSSSSFGLYALSIQFTVALCILAGAALLTKPFDNVALLGALLLTCLLLWAYFAFMQYFIIWSGNLPNGVVWYQRRGAALWGAAEYLITILHLGPTLALFFPPVRRSRAWLLALIGLVLAGKTIEVAWLALPEKADPTTLASLFVAGLAVVGLGLLFATAFDQARRHVARSATSTGSP